jgi:ABC-type Fe3+/spermidine/putrescine transport system ATPase subunit
MKNDNAASLKYLGINYTYPGNGRKAIDNVSIEVNAGELVVLVGPSGCGKTTLLKIVAGLIEPDEGKLLIDNESAAEIQPEKRGFGWVPQNYALFEYLNIEDNVGFGLKMRKVPKQNRQKKVDELLHLCRISDYAKRSVRELSGGQRQRVAIARALAVDPRVLLLDEPLSALDPQLRIALRADLEQLLRNSGVTCLFVTHDQSEAMAIADKVVVVKDGKIEQIGSPEHLWAHPADAFVAEFISNARVIKAKATDTRTVNISGSMHCRLNKDVEPGTMVEVALRRENFIISPDGEKARVEFCEYNGGQYYARARTTSGICIPFHNELDIPIGSDVLLASDKESELAVVGK